MWSSAASLLAGVAGWLSVKMLADPLIAIYALRMDVQEAVILYGNLPLDARTETRAAASARFSKVGAALCAHLAAWPWVRCFYLRFLRWDPYGAGASCMELGELIRDEAFFPASLAGFAPLLQHCLRLPVAIPASPRRATADRDTAGWARTRVTGNARP